jgi:hypothetical protein
LRVNKGKNVSFVATNSGISIRQPHRRRPDHLQARQAQAIDKVLGADTREIELDVPGEAPCPGAPICCCRFGVRSTTARFGSSLGNLFEPMSNTIKQSPLAA